MAHDAELVAIGIPEVRAVVVLVILRPHARRSFRDTTASNSHIERFIHNGARRCKESHHLPVTCDMGFAIIRSPDEQQRARAGRGLPACPRALSFAEARLNTENCGERRVEAHRSLEVGNADEDVGEHCATR